MWFAVCAVDGYAFAFEFVGEEINFVDVFWFCCFWEVDCFADGVVGVFLECCLDFNVPFWCDVKAGGEEFAGCWWQVFDGLDASLSGDFQYECFA